MCKQEQPVLQSRYRSVDPSNNHSPIRGLRPGLCKDSTENPPQKKLWDFNSVSQKWSKALISPSQVKTMQS